MRFLALRRYHSASVVLFSVVLLDALCRRNLESHAYLTFPFPLPNTHDSSYSESCGKCLEVEEERKRSRLRFVSFIYRYLLTRDENKRKRNLYIFPTRRVISLITNNKGNACGKLNPLLWLVIWRRIAKDRENRKDNVRFPQRPVSERWIQSHDWLTACWPLGMKSYVFPFPFPSSILARRWPRSRIDSKSLRAKIDERRKRVGKRERKIPLETALKRFVQRTGIDSRTLFRHGFSLSSFLSFAIIAYLNLHSRPAIS